MVSNSYADLGLPHDSVADDHDPKSRLIHTQVQNRQFQGEAMRSLALCHVGYQSKSFFGDFHVYLQIHDLQLDYRH